MSRDDDANLPLDISESMWLLLMGQFIAFCFSSFQSYFGGFRKMWRSCKQENEGHVYGLSSEEIGQMMLWRGEMNHGAIAIMLLWVVLPALHTREMNPLAFDMLFVAHSCWLGIKLAFLGPTVVAVFSLLMDPRSWLATGWVLLGWKYASWQSAMACFILPMYGLYVNMFIYPQKVHHVPGKWAPCCRDWNFATYRQAMSCVRDPGIRTWRMRCRSRFPSSLERERVIVLLLERYAGRWVTLPSDDSAFYLMGGQSPTARSSARWPALRRRAAWILASVLVCAALVVVVVRARATKQNWVIRRDVCKADTGGVCDLFGCDPFRNAICNKTDWDVFGHCVCEPGFCAVDGMCVPKPAHWHLPLWRHTGVKDHKGSAPVPVRGHRALVFSGGGAKGAWEVGVLEALCDPSTVAGRSFGNWTMLVGTSIGALNAGFLAQFPPEEQCTKGLAAAKQYWNSIKVEQDVYEANSGFHFDNFDHTTCLRVAEAPSIVDSFINKGGLCDPSPGANTYSYEVDPEKIRRSGMRLFVVSTSLNTSKARWWTDQSPDILEGCLASGAIAPLLYPKVHNGEWFIDGGLVANSPVSKAVIEGASEILVMIVRPMKLPKYRAQPPLGMSILEFEFDLLMFKCFVESELETACQLAKIKGSKILGYAPDNDMQGSMLDFTDSRIAAMQQDGYEFAASRGPVDLCAWLTRAKGTDFLPPDSTDNDDEHFDAAEALASEGLSMTTSDADSLDVTIVVCSAVILCGFSWMLLSLWPKWQSGNPGGIPVNAGRRIRRNSRRRRPGLTHHSSFLA